jgi:hypothetical protein
MESSLFWCTLTVPVRCFFKYGTVDWNDTRKTVGNMQAGGASADPSRLPAAMLLKKAATTV